MTRVSIAVAFVLALLLPRAAVWAQSDNEEEEDAAQASPAAADEEEPPGGKKKKKGKKRAPEPADEEEPESERASVKATASADAGGELIEQGSPKGRMTLPGGKFMLSAIVETNLAKSQAGKPLSVAPDLWIGLHDRLTVGIYHSGRAATGFLSGFGTGLCFRGGGGGMGTGMGGGMGNLCKVGLGEVYTFGGGELRIGLTEGGFATALVLGGNARFIDPEKLFAGKAGILARIHARRIAIEISPMVFVGLNKRDEVMGVSLNPDLIFVPVTIFLRFAPRFSFALQGGLSSTLKKLGDNYEIPAAAGISFWVNNHFAIDAAFGLAAVADKDDMTKAFDQRSATVGLSYAM